MARAWGFHSCLLGPLIPYAPEPWGRKKTGCGKGRDLLPLSILPRRG